MDKFINKSETYDRIIEVVCQCKGISKSELHKILKDKECKYLLFMLLNKYNCTDMDKISEDFSIDNIKTIKNSLKKGEERFFVSGNFRDMYLEAEDSVELRAKKLVDGI